jgi:hypothetical protein
MNLDFAGNVVLIKEVRVEVHERGARVMIDRALPGSVYKSIQQFHKRAMAGRWTGWTKMPPLEADFM